MKRIRENDEQEGVIVDWSSLLHMECILVVLHPYLSTVDLIHLSCVNKRMNTTWINNERRLSVLQMRDRILKLTGRKYEVKNPLLFVKKAAIKALKCYPPPAMQGLKKTFKCIRCNAAKTIATLAMDRVLFPYATCGSCAESGMEKRYEHCYNENHCVQVLMKYFQKYSVDNDVARQWCWNFTGKPGFSFEFRKQVIYLNVSHYTARAFVPKSFFQSIVEQGLREIIH
jgi:transcription elongation factor Elf1